MGEECGVRGGKGVGGERSKAGEEGGLEGDGGRREKKGGAVRRGKEGGCRGC